MTPRYHAERVLGRGRHASLWLAFDRERRENIALKVAPDAGLATEFETLARLRSTQIVRASECGRLADRRSYIAMEYVTGGDLAHTHAPGESVAAHWLHGAATALAAVHRRGWVHRDVKPAHFLRRADGTLALCDFGSACAAGTHERLGTPSVIGTPRYAAPEQIEGAAASPAADVYSLGVCAFEWLAGRPPFRGETLTELFSQHVRAPVPRLPAGAAHWQGFVEALLAKDPARRPTDGSAVLARLAAHTGEVM